jgi:nucleotide-binding universal stress UspA family protein
VSTLKTVLMVIPSAKSVDCALRAYKALPSAEARKLIAMHVSPIAVSYGLGADMVLAGFIQAQRQAIKQEQMATAAAFAQACQRAGLAYEWRAEESLDYLLSAHAGARARAADLVMFPEPREGSSIGRHQLEELVFASGRPVLAIPADWSGSSLARRIVVAWDGGREAARAVFDALPFLQQAETVRIVSVQGVLDEPVRQFTPGDEIAATLSRHGIRAECATFQSVSGSVKEELQRQVLDIGADMVVMGCYGHSRFREMILGGVSRDMLRNIPFPLLLAS